MCFAECWKTIFCQFHSTVLKQATKFPQIGAIKFTYHECFTVNGLGKTSTTKIFLFIWSSTLEVIFPSYIATRGA